MEETNGVKDEFIKDGGFKNEAFRDEEFKDDVKDGIKKVTIGEVTEIEEVMKDRLNPDDHRRKRYFSQSSDGSRSRTTSFQSETSRYILDP